MSDAPVPYGIIDPDYARVFTMARCLAWAEGYAIAMHGSFTRDLDLLAVPWTEQACEPEHLVRRIADAAGLDVLEKPPTEKPHGRLAYTLTFKAFADPRFIDISVMPRAEAAEGREAKLREALRRAVALLEGVKRGGWVTSPAYEDEINLGLAPARALLGGSHADR